MAGVYDLIFKAEPNNCAMTYMYEYPQYIPVNTSQAGKYRLLVYGEGEEGRRVRRLRAGKMSGAPVLFIAGNAGSHKQVRSLASVALRKAGEDHKKTHFDFYSVDFSEEWSAFHGGLLDQQTRFVAESIAKILELYDNSAQSVVLVGHSMGGLVAKAVLMYPELTGPDTVKLIINLATPDTPVVVLDWETHQFYQKVSRFWSESRPQDVTLVSISGGQRDLQVRSGLTQDPHADIQTSSEAVPGSWVSADHKCIVWCKQLVLTLTRALFDLVDSDTKQITEDIERRREVLHYHLVHRAWGKEYEEEKMRPADPVRLGRASQWSEVTERQVTLERDQLTAGQYHMIQLVPGDPDRRQLTLEALHTESDHWVFGCLEAELSQGVRRCVKAESLSGRSVLMPSRGKRKMIQLDLEELSKLYSDVVINIPELSDKTRVNVDLYNPRERSLSYAVPKWINFWRSLTLLERTVAGSVYYNLSLTGLELPWQSYLVTVLPVKCSPAPHYGLARLVTPWSSDVTHVLLARPGDNSSTNTVTARLQSSRPVNDSRLPAVQLFLDPACQYTVKIQPSIPSMMGQMVRYYTPLLVPCLAAVNLLILAFQFRRMESDLYCQSTLLTLLTAVSPINVVLPSKLVAYVLTQFSIETDISIIQARGWDFGVLPIMMFFISIGLMFLLICAAWGLIVVCGSLANKAVTRWASHLSPHELLADLAVSALAKFPVILACLLLALGFSTCGSLALCAGCFCYFLKLFKMYQEYLEGLVKRAVGIRDEDDPSVLLGVNFQFSLALLWLINTLLNLPVLITWSQNVSLGAGAGASLPSDPSLVHLVVMAPCLALLWQNEGKPRVERKYFSILAVVLHGLALAIATFAMVSLYRLPYIISAAFLAVALHQTLSPLRTSEAEEREEREEDHSLEEKKTN